ncbi:hypothetical protein L3Q82_016670 [Scortum barcoo]|uniref:Uncharacterized protein n=1 Tax=Scortum barcoo TaxID=214431 RepID=A0ACB8X7X9_9TELE|nr:hypothetical protein L3Q82_016670 [Scortum barcoo]
MAFGIPLSQVIANDRAYKRRQDALKESRRDCLDLEASILRFRAEKRQFFNGNKPLVGSSSITGGGPGSPSANSVAPAPISESQNKPLSPTFLDNTSRGQRRGGLSVDSISDLVESQSRLLEALQLSHPAELELKKSPGGRDSSEGRTQTKLSLNPIYRQVPRVLERCCSHIESHGLQTVGIFRVGSSKKRVRQLREDFDMGVDIQLDEEHSVHDVAALLKEFLRDMPDPLLPRELYPAFLHANLLRGADQLQYLQHLLYLLPPCNCDTLLRLLSLLHTVQSFAQDSIGTNDEEVRRAPFAPHQLDKDLYSKKCSSEKLFHSFRFTLGCKTAPVHAEGPGLMKPTGQHHLQKAEMKSCGSQTWTPSGPWLRLEILSIKIMNRTGDKGQALPESNMYWEQRRVSQDSPTTSRDLRYSGRISSTPGALPPEELTNYLSDFGLGDGRVHLRDPSLRFLIGRQVGGIEEILEIPGNKMTSANLAVIFGPNLLQRERGDSSQHIYTMGIEDSTAIINVTLVLVQNHRRLFTVSAELQQEVLMSLIQTDPDIIDYLLRRKLSGSHLTVEGGSESGGRRDTGASLDSVGASSGSLSPLEPPSPLFPPDGNGGEGSLTSEVFLNVLKLNQNRKRQETRYGEVPPGKSIRHMRQFHSHHNLLSLAQPSTSSTSRLHAQDQDSQDRRGPLGSALSFTLGGVGGGGGGGSCSSLSGSTESSIWVRQTPQEESKPSPAANFWDFFTGKGSGSETMV